MTQNLFSAFPPSSKLAWLDQLSKELKGKSVSETLNFKLWGEIDLEAYYTPGDVKSSILDAQVRFHPDSDLPGMPPRIWSNLVSVFPDDTNAGVLDALSNGAEGLVLHTYGIEDLGELLRRVLPEYIQILVKPLGNPVMALRAFFEWADSTGTSPDRISGGLLWTPSDLVFDHQESFEFAIETLQELAEMSEPYSNFKVFSIDSARYSDSGANPLDALIFGMGELIEVIDKSGLDPGLIFRKMLVQVSVSDAHFGEIARIKSCRILLSSLAGLYGQEVFEEDFAMLCHTSYWSKSILDPNTNLIRQTYEAMAAVLGGANLLWVKPLQEDSADERERRIARNVSSILKEEAYLDKVQDPAAGSFFLDQMVLRIAEFIQTKLQELESQGGWLAKLNSGGIHAQVRGYREKIQNELLESKRSKIGVNKYPSSQKPDSSTEFEIFEEKSLELKPARASYLCELQTLLQP